jgi:hypothetical protein
VKGTARAVFAAGICAPAIEGPSKERRRASVAAASGEGWEIPAEARVHDDDRRLDRPVDRAPKRRRLPFACFEFAGQKNSGFNKQQRAFRPRASWVSPRVVVVTLCRPPDEKVELEDFEIVMCGGTRGNSLVPFRTRLALQRERVGLDWIDSEHKTGHAQSISLFRVLLILGNIEGIMASKVAIAIRRSRRTGLVTMHDRPRRRKAFVFFVPPAYPRPLPARGPFEGAFRN